MRRRELLELGSAAAVWAAVRRPVTGQASAPLQRAAIPSSGEQVVRVGLGTWQTFDVGADAARRRDLAETLRVFVEAGANLVDTSPMYGSSESVLGDLVAQAKIREKLFVATKVWTTGERAGIEQMEASAAKLKSPKLDLIQIHNLVDWRTHLATLRKWKDQGRIRYLGITHYQAGAIDQVSEIVRREPLDFVQMNLSLAEPEAETALLRLCADRKVAFIANRPFGGGNALSALRGKPLPPWAGELAIGSWAQLLLKWVLSHPEVTCAIPGTGNPRHLADNLAAARGPALDPAGRERLARAWRER